MLLSSSRSKKKNETGDIAPRKSSRISRNQTNPSQESISEHLSDSNSDDDTIISSNGQPKVTKQRNELTIRIRYKVREQEEAPHSLHVQLLQLLINNVQPTIAICNKNHEILKPATVTMMANESNYAANFDLHYTTRQKQEDMKQVVIIQTIKTTSTIAYIKKQPGILPFLKANNIQVSAHEWISTIWDVTTIGFFSKYSPQHHPKDMATFHVNTQLAHIKKLPHFRLRQVAVQSSFKGRRLRIQVYAVEVAAKDARQAESLILKHMDGPEDFISFRLRNVNPKAFNNAVAIIAQHQNDLRTVVVNNVSSEAFFVLEGEARQLENVITVHHYMGKQSMRITTYQSEFQKVRKAIKNAIPTWITKMDPSDLRSCGDPPVLANIRRDDYSNDSASDLSQSIDSLLSIDIWELDILKSSIPSEMSSASFTMADTSTSDTKKSKIELRFEAQQQLIETQGKRLEALVQTLMGTEQKLDTVLLLLNSFTTEQEKIDQDSIPSRRP